MRIVVTWVLIAVSLAGCSGNGSGGDPAGASADPEAETLANGTVTVKNELAAPLHRVEWANGTFMAHETCNTLGCLTDDGSGFHYIPLELPRDVPVRLGVQLDFESTPSSDFFGGMDTWLNADATFFRYTVERGPGQVRLDVTLLPTADAEVVVAAYNPSGEGAEMPYALRIAVDAHNEIITAGVPVALELGPGDNIWVNSPEEVTTTFLVYAPDDAFIGRYETNFTLPSDAAEGEYVVLIPPGAPAANITTDAGIDSMRTLGLRFVDGEIGTFPPNGEYDLDFEVTGFPLAVGFWMQSTGAAAGLMASTAVTAQLTGPNGIEVDSGQVCGLCLSGGWGYGISTESGDSRVVAGTYHLHAETQATYEMESAPFAVYFQRLA